MPDIPARMRAIVHKGYGPDGIQLREDVEVPAIGDDQTLVRVHASSVNPVEWYGVQGPIFVRVRGGLRAPKGPRIGIDLAGRVEAVGAAVTGLTVGDEVFGSSGWSWAEYAPAREVKLAAKPANISFEEAATVPVAGLTALQAVRDHGRIEPGQKVLINGASGGVGTFAVQVAKAFGAEVTAVCSTRNIEQARLLGADRVCDYTQEDFTRSGDRYDVVLDVAGSRSLRELRRVVTPKGTVVAVGAPMSAKGLGPLKHLAAMRILAIGRSETVRFFLAKIEKADLEQMSDLLADGKVRPIIERRYDLSEAADALAYLGTTHARGKIVLTV